MDGDKLATVWIISLQKFSKFGILFKFRPEYKKNYNKEEKEIKYIFIQFLLVVAV